MIKFLQLSEQRRIEIIEQVNAKTGLRTNAIEKDWWVTLALKAAFSTPYSSQLLFKGGTSLSKSWGLIERFSEDIDFVLNIRPFAAWIIPTFCHKQSTSFLHRK
jgi:nucleotidyltransferase AbiEii toxin of type IV toxin-antitoxin system